MGRTWLTALILVVTAGVVTSALAQRSARSALWREWATIENQWQVERRALAQDRERYRAQQAAKSPPRKTKKKKKKKK